VSCPAVEAVLGADVLGPDVLGRCEPLTTAWGLICGQKKTEEVVEVV
jgi:hypothetical protein